MALRAIELMRSDATFHELDLDRAEMRVRVGLIGAMGTDRDRSALLDPETVADWFLASLGPETADTVRADTLSGLANLSIERVRELRSIKNSLGVVAHDHAARRREHYTRRRVSSSIARGRGPDR